MEQMRVEILDGRTAFAPGEEIKGIVAWQTSKRVETVEIRLFWYTRGKGTQDVEIVDAVRNDSPGSEGGMPLSFIAPNGPYSFSGMLISLMWAIELVLFPSGIAEKIDITISPTGEEIILKKVVL